MTRKRVHDDHQAASNAAFHVRVTGKLAPRPFNAFFEWREQALTCSNHNHLREPLAQGIVPQAPVEGRGTLRSSWTLSRCIAGSLRRELVPVSDV